jgi:hypothetical protein
MVQVATRNEKPKCIKQEEYDKVEQCLLDVLESMTVNLNARGAVDVHGEPTAQGIYGGALPQTRVPYPFASTCQLDPFQGPTLPVRKSYTDFLFNHSVIYRFIFKQEVCHLA